MVLPRVLIVVRAGPLEDEDLVMRLEKIKEGDWRERAWLRAS